MFQEAFLLGSICNHCVVLHGAYANCRDGSMQILLNGYPVLERTSFSFEAKLI
jgi:hypothetical protein